MSAPAFGVAAAGALLRGGTRLLSAPQICGRKLPRDTRPRSRPLTCAPLAHSPLHARQQLDAQGKEYIRLDGFLKVQGMAGTGGQAKMLIQDGMVKVNGETEVRRGKKLRHGDTVLVRGELEPVAVEFE
jgi:ribosome-associated protein